MGRVAHQIDEQVGPPLWAAVAERAAGQWGVVSLVQLGSLGAGRGAVARAVEGGRLHRVHRGVYAVGHRALGREGRALAAVMACGEGAVLSHRSAGRWWELIGADGSGLSDCLCEVGLLS